MRNPRNKIGTYLGVYIFCPENLLRWDSLGEQAPGLGLTAQGAGLEAGRGLTIFKIHTAPGPGFTVFFLAPCRLGSYSFRLGAWNLEPGAGVKTPENPPCHRTLRPACPSWTTYTRQSRQLYLEEPYFKAFGLRV